MNAAQQITPNTPNCEESVKAHLRQLEEQLQAHARAMDDEIRVRNRAFSGGGLIGMLVQTFGFGALGLVTVVVLATLVFEPIADADRDRATVDREIAKETNTALLEVARKQHEAARMNSDAVVKMAEAIADLVAELRYERNERRWMPRTPNTSLDAQP